MGPVAWLALAGYGAWLVIASGITAVLLAWDKRQSARSGWRVSERTLHLWELAGGFPGSYLIRSRLRHKTFKRRYRVGCALASVGHVACVVVMALLMRSFAGT